jgi:hypothetical protein
MQDKNVHAISAMRQRIGIAAACPGSGLSPLPAGGHRNNHPEMTGKKSLEVPVGASVAVDIDCLPQLVRVREGPAGLRD